MSPTMLRLLLRVYPRSFREEYGRELEGILRLRGQERRGAMGRLLLLARMCVDTCVNAALVHAEILRHDLRLAARSWRRAPGFAIAVVLVAGLGIGATTAVFSILDHLYLRPLPYRDADRIVEFVQDQTPLGYPNMELSPSMYRDWAAQATSFAGMAAYSSRAMNLVGAGEPMRLRGYSVTASFFDVMGVDAALGRVLRPDDDVQGAAGTVVLGYEIWRSYFGADEHLIGRSIDLDGEQHMVVGVMPADFEFPGRDADFFRPFRFQASHFEDPNNYYLHGVGRLADGVSTAQADAELDAITARLDAAESAIPDGTRARVWQLRDDIGRTDRLLLAGAAGAALCVLLIGCANLASLLLTRAASRERELAIRTALGAGRERLVRQLLTENATLAAVGGVVGVAGAAVAMPALSALIPSHLPLAASPQLDARVLLLAGLLTAVTGIAFGVFPAYRTSRLRVTHLRDGDRAGVGPRSERLRAVFVFAQVATSVALLVTAGLLVRSLWAVQQIDPGFTTRNVVSLQTPLPLPRYAVVETRHRFYGDVLAGVRAIPGVESAAYTSFLPIDFGGGIWPVELPGVDVGAGGRHFASLRYVTSDFFRTMDMPLVLGRDVAESDTLDREAVAVVSRSFAARHWPGQSPLGRRFTMAFLERVIVGVVDDIRVRGLEREDSEPQVYLPYGQVPDGGMVFYTPKELVVRTAGDEGAVIPDIRRAIRAADPYLPIAAARSLDDVLDEDTAPRRVQASLLAAFAIVAVLLTAVGIHGLIAFTVSLQQRELGVRMALGATPTRVLRLVLGRAITLAAIGAAAGLAVAWLASSWLRSLLYGVSQADPATFAAGAAICIVMTVAGTLGPAIRAIRIDPVRVIRG